MYKNLEYHLPFCSDSKSPLNRTTLLNNLWPKILLFLPSYLLAIISACSNSLRDYVDGYVAIPTNETECILVLLQEQ